MSRSVNNPDSVSSPRHADGPVSRRNAASAGHGPIAHEKVSELPFVEGRVR